MPSARIRLVGDITCLPTAGGWLYLACRLDLATREVVGYAMADHHRAELVTDALGMAHGRAHVEPGCVIHSDRGSEYTSARFRDRIRALGLRQSRGRTGSRFDNTAAESFWALLKEETGTRTWPPPAQTQNLRLSHPGRDQAAPPTRSRGITNECPRARGNFKTGLTLNPGTRSYPPRSVVIRRSGERLCEASPTGCRCGRAASSSRRWRRESRSDR
ncbi:DDE-type integrase/transposase/recombinase [Streptomyces lacrimifluminis]|uniref:DDE-type integrase/transposase/recombinase n=1 Tax=Streptomyces lacrimifluminis TaxID=1500077 RepID=UPI00166CA30C